MLNVAMACRWVLLAVAIIGAALLFRNPGAQSVDFTFPYFSGAANSKSLYDWRISPSDYERVKGLSVRQYLKYRHQRTADVRLNSYNNYGYVLVVLAARTLFWWMGDGNAVVTLQIIVHTAISLTILALLSTPVRRWTFAILFAVNPVVLHFVTFPYYYFWAVVPCFLVAFLSLHDHRSGIGILPIAMLLFLGFLIRPPTLFVCLLAFALMLWQGRRLMALIAFCAFALLQFQAIGHFYTSPWHTAYIGVGAYPNPYGIQKPLDSAGFDLYRRATGRQMSSDPITGSFQDPQERDDYWRILRARYLEIVTENPALIGRNAALNIVQSFGLGYDVDRPWVTLLSTVVGLMMIGFIVLTRQWIWGLGILTYAVAFAPYFPPIPAYLFGAYLFTALAVAGVADELWRRSLGRYRALRSASMRVVE